VRLVDRKPEESDCMSGSKRASPAQCCVMAPTSTRPAFGLSLPQSASLVGSPPPVVDAAPQLPHRFECLPARDHCGGSDPVRGGEMVNFGVHHLPCPVAHQRQKNRGRSLHFLPSRAAPPTRRARPAHADPHPTALYRRGHGQSVPTRLQCGLPGTALTTTARALPSDSADL